MKRSFCMAVIGIILGSSLTLALAPHFWGAVQPAIALGQPTPAGNGDVNADGDIDITDAI